MDYVDILNIIQILYCVEFRFMASNTFISDLFSYHEERV